MQGAYIEYDLPSPSIQTHAVVLQNPNKVKKPKFESKDLVMLD